VRTLAPGPEDADEHQERPDGVTDAPHTVILGVAPGPSRAVGIPASDTLWTRVLRRRKPSSTRTIASHPSSARCRAIVSATLGLPPQSPVSVAASASVHSMGRRGRDTSAASQCGSVVGNRIGDQRPARRCRAAGIIGSGRAGGKPRPLTWRMPRKPLTDASLPLARRPGPSYARYGTLVRPAQECC
jgi:hypothetical protein